MKLGNTNQAIEILKKLNIGCKEKKNDINCKYLEIYVF